MSRKEEFKKGEEYQYTFSFTQDQVEEFSKITGDTNPIHLDEEFAKNTIFKKRIMHGALSTSVFSNILGTKFPGNGTIYLSQEVKYLIPMYASETYVCSVTVEEIKVEKKILILDTTIRNDAGDMTVSGKAVVKVPFLENQI
jgi:acyl dehydratase